MLKLLTFSVLTTLLLSTAISQNDESSSMICAPAEDLDAQATCQVFNITPVVAAGQPIRILGEPKTFRDDIVTSLIFSDVTLNYIPSNAFQYFPNVEFAEFTNVSLQHLAKDAFINCGRLNTIVIVDNAFDSVSRAFARECGDLRNVSMRSNAIKTVDESALEGLEKLTVFDLSNNQLACLPPKLFASTPKIARILLASNKIPAIDAATFSGLKSLVQIDLTDNRISAVPAMDFTGTSATGGLIFDVSNNPIIAIKEDFLEKFFKSRPKNEEKASQVTMLMAQESDSCIGATDAVATAKNFQKVSRNLKNCYSQWTKELNDLKVVCGEDAEIDDDGDDLGSLEVPAVQPTKPEETTTLAAPPKVDDTVQETTAVGEVCTTDKQCRFYLDHKRRYTCVIDGAEATLASIGGIHLENFTDDDVTRVYFANSKLRHIPMVLFTKFKKMSFLSLADSPLGIISKNSLKACSELVYLDVSNCEIIHVSRGAFEKCEKLTTVDMSGNPVNVLDRNNQAFILNNQSPPEAY